MTDIFLEILNTSVAASWVVLAVAAARLLLKKAPRWMICALWALVALRLLWPGSIEAPFSMIPSREIIPPQSLFDAAPAIDSGVAIIDNVVNPVYTESLRATPGASVNPLQVWLAVFANLWMLGMGAMALWAAVSCRRVRRQLRERILLEGNVYLCDRVESPFIFGLFRPMICLPSSLDETTRNHVISHEKAHISRRDHWWKPLGFVLLTINWFNPILWLAYILLCRDIEMACDERVARNMDVNEKKAYSSALLQCSIRSRCVTVCPLAFGEVGVKQRVRSVLHYKKPAFWVILVTAVLIVILAAGLLTDPVEQVSELCYNGNLYVLEHQDVSFLPVEETSIGTLRSILHHTSEHPTEELQATNLDESLTGCPLYLEEDRLYLQKYDGTCLAFRMAAPEVQTFTKGSIQLGVTIPYGWIAERIDGPDHFGFRFRREDLTNGWITVTYWPSRVTHLDWAGTVKETQFPSGMTGEVFYAQDAESWDWSMVYFYADADCMSVEKPDNYLWPTEYHTQAMNVIGSITVMKDGTAHFIQNDTGPQPTLEITAIEQNGTNLSIGIPNLWSREQLTINESHLGLQCRPSGREDWMSIRYYWTNDAIYGCNLDNQVDPITLSNSLRGNVYYTDDPNRWNRIILETTQGHLYIDFLMDTADWTDDEYRMALSFLSTLAVVRDGESVLTAPNRLGIELRVQNADTQRLSLICTQQGHEEEWAEILTDTQWTIERQEDNVWVNIMPRETAWPEVMYIVNRNNTTTWSIDVERVMGALEPGHYRISKTFYGHPHPDGTKSTIEGYEQICYAKFEVNPLGISLRATNVSPWGLTLVCRQDGTLWNGIFTGAQWMLEQKVDGQWISLLPADTTWTAEAYSVNLNSATSWNLNWNSIIGELGPGEYRVGKHFTGERERTASQDRERFEQILYTEFEIY